MRNLQANEGTCPDCGTAVVWIGSPVTDQRAFDLPAENMYRLGSDGAQLVEVFRSHFDTCPVRNDRRRLHTTIHDAAPRLER